MNAYEAHEAAARNAKIDNYFSIALIVALFSVPAVIAIQHFM